MIKTEAIILKSADLNETGRNLIVYSEKLGKINIRAIGVKKVESKLRPHIESISYVQMILVEGKNSLILKDAILLDQFLNIKKNLERIKIAKKIADLIDEAIAGQEKDEDIWKLVLKTFEDLNNIDSTSVASDTTSVDKFQKKIIQLLGYDPETIKQIENLY